MADLPSLSVEISLNQPGFALPEAVLQSIPLPVDFDEVVRAANDENRDKIALFRRQGLVNKLTLQALESVGLSLSQLAREIENRDRVLELLTAHLNQHGDRVQRHYSGLARHIHALTHHLEKITGDQKEQSEREAMLTAYTRQLTEQIEEVAGNLHTQMQRDAETANTRVDQLTQQIEEVAGNLHTQLEQDSIIANTRTSILTAISRATEGRLKDLNQRVSSLQNDLKFKAESSRLEDQEQRATNEGAALRQRVTTLENDLSIAKVQSEKLEAERSKQRADFDRNQASSLEKAFKKINSLESELSTRIARIEKEHSSQLDEAAKKIEALESTLSAQLKSIKEHEATNRSKAVKRENSLASSIRSANVGHKDLTAQIDSLRSDLLSVVENCSNLERRQESSEASLSAFSNISKQLLPTIRAQLQRLAEVDEAHQQEAASEALETATDAETVQMDGFYAALEARFRGPRALIRERQSHYLQTIDDARERVETFPPVLRSTDDEHPLDSLYATRGLLDLGCGRGEWLELLKERNLSAIGIEMNQFFLGTCRERGVEVIEANLVKFLSEAPADTVSVITGFHVIEHLPFPILQKVIRDCFRILRRGGIVIFETPNPGNILTSALNFRIDPTHQHPVHPALGEFLLQNGGFSNVRLEFLHPYDSSKLVGAEGDPVADRFNAYFHGPQDYAVIGVKP
ncbi:methyltransferase domain-containing protein [Synoicihabitans lomoniglobus]|uniref:methyltransferase domain-containing protein n=1 Tax=Synoicihabitans lomoniglobus TaxID=2909285 RepID=UPI002ED3AFBE|nr:methyltransferase domain-containing protein [Opitutaceae bacterium LMO-M01]